MLNLICRAGALKQQRPIHDMKLIERINDWQQVWFHLVQILFTLERLENTNYIHIYLHFRFAEISRYLIERKFRRCLETYARTDEVNAGSRTNSGI